MTFTTCPDCGTRKIVVHPNTTIARIRSHTLPTDLTTTCPGSGKKA
jgi:hypothetical protein